MDWDDYTTGAAFSGVYDPVSRRLVFRPSGETRLANGQEPPDLVPQRDGHGIVNIAFCEATGSLPTGNLGFTVFLEADRTLTVEWLSRSVNGRNLSFAGDYVPENLRTQIVDDIAKLTGREARSRQ